MNNNFLPKFDISNNLSSDLRNIEIAKQLTTGWYKGKFDYHLRKAGFVSMINGEEYYTNIPMLYLQRDFYNEGTQGWHIAEWLRLIGLQDSDLDEIRTIGNTKDVDGIYHSWKAKLGISSSQFKHNMEIMKELLIDVDEVRIDYENQRYKTSVYTTGALRPYNTKESLYGDSLAWASGKADVNLWTTDGRIITLPDLQTKPNSSGYGKAIRLYKDSIDVTSNYNETIKNAVQSMIMYSGNSFMQRISSNKISETVTTVYVTTYESAEHSEYISVTGTEVFDATIKQSFIDDIDDLNFIRYTAMYDDEGGASESPTIIEGRSELLTIRAGIYNSEIKVTLASDFWMLIGYARSLNTTIFMQPIVNNGDEFLFYNTNNSDIGAYIKVSEFKKLSMDELSYYIGEYFDIRVTQDDGGFFSGFIGFIAGFLGVFFNGIYQIFDWVPITRLQLQILTKVVNKLFGSDLSKREVFDIEAQVIVAVVAILLAPETGGMSLGLTAGEFTAATVALSLSVSLGVAGSKADREKTESENKAEVDKQRKEELAEVRKLENEQKEREKELNSEGDKSEKEEFQSFLNNPLYRFDRERNKMKSDFEKQFKLL